MFEHLTAVKWSQGISADLQGIGFSREGAATAGNSAQAGSGGPNPKMTLLLVFNIFRNSTFYTNVDYVPSFILCNLVVGGSTGILAASWPF